MNHLNAFSRYAVQADRVAQEMLKEPDNTPVTFGNARPGSLEVFKWAGRHVHVQTIQRLGDTMPAILKRRNVLYGMLVVSRFVYMSAQQARALELGPDVFLGTLTHPSTFAQTLGAIATNDNLIAEGLELSYGLRSKPALPEALARYAFEADGSISLMGLGQLAKDYREGFEARGEVIREDAICAAHRAQALEGIFDAVAPILAKHPALGGAIFSETQIATQPPPAFVPQ